MTRGGEGGGGLGLGDGGGGVLTLVEGRDNAMSRQPLPDGVAQLADGYGCVRLSPGSPVTVNTFSNQLSVESESSGRTGNGIVCDKQ